MLFPIYRLYVARVSPTRTASFDYATYEEAFDALIEYRVKDWEGQIFGIDEAGIEHDMGV
jgi:hypothetical protein